MKNGNKHRYNHTRSPAICMFSSPIFIFALFAWFAVRNMSPATVWVKNLSPLFYSRETVQLSSFRLSILLKCFVLFVTRTRLFVSAQEAIIRSKSSSEVPFLRNYALSLPNISADSFPVGIMSKLDSIAFILARLPVIRSEL